MTDGVTDAVRERLRDARGFIFDMDGTLVLGDRVNHGLRPLPGAVAMLEWVRDRGLPYVVFTNGTNRSPAHFSQVLREAGLAVPEDRMMTPASSAVVMFTKHGYKRVMVLGGDGMAVPLREAGIEVVPPVAEAGPVDAVFVGWFPEFTMPALQAACEAVWGGAVLFSASETPFFASANGRALGTSRAISAMIRSLTGCRLRITGKPSLDALRAAASRLGVRPASLAVVGDDPLLEVPMAHRGHALAIAVGTGLGGADAYDHLPAERQPHLHLNGVDELLALVTELSLSLLCLESRHERCTCLRIHGVRRRLGAARDHGAHAGARPRPGAGAGRGRHREPDRPRFPAGRAAAA